MALTLLLQTLARHREVLFRTTVNEVRFRYAGSLLGMFWLVLAPLILMAIYAAVYLVVFRVRPADMPAEHYVLYVLSGLIPFLGFSEALTAGSTSLSLNKAILLSTVFPAEMVPLRAVASSQAPTAMGILIAIAASAAFGLASPAMVAIPAIWILLVLFVAGIAWLLSLASLIAKDIPQILAFVNMALLVASPIGYTADMVPAAMQKLLYLNPLSHYIDAFHDVLVFQRWPSAQTWVVMIVLALGSAGFGFWVFQKAKRVFFDYA